MKDGKIIAIGTTEELVNLVEGKVWDCSVPGGEIAMWEKKLQVVNLRNEADGTVSLRYLSDRPKTEASVMAQPRLEDLYLWMFPQGRNEA